MKTREWKRRLLLTLRPDVPNWKKMKGPFYILTFLSNIFHLRLLCSQIFNMMHVGNCFERKPISVMGKCFSHLASSEPLLGSAPSCTILTMMALTHDRICRYGHVSSIKDYKTIILKVMNDCKLSDHIGWYSTISTYDLSFVVLFILLPWRFGVI